MTVLFQPESGILTVQYQPDENTRLLENPPRFTWMAAQLDEDRYVLQVSRTSDFAEADTETYRPIPYNFFTPSRAYEAGTYYWRYALLLIDEEGRETGSQSDWSKIRSFTVEEGLPETSLPSREERYASVHEEHPRLWLGAKDLPEFRRRVREDASFCGWDVFMEKSVTPWLKRDLIAEPARYPNNQRVAKLWRQMYIDCQEMLYAIRHLSVAGVVLEDESIIAAAKEWFLHALTWDTEGTTARDYNDEAAFRMAGALAWGYDWLYHYLSDEERGLARSKLLRRTEQVAFHVIERSQIHQVPYDSHAVRSLSSVMTPCCIALLHEEPKAREWLDYTLEYFSCLYTPWGGEDGGWAEGPMYWTTQMAFVTEAMNLIKSYIGLDLYQRPFFAKTGDFPLYCYSPDTTRASFCDQSTLGDPVPLKTAYNIRQYAGITGNGLYQWYCDQVIQNDPGTEMKFYNYGWWDFAFDDLQYRWSFPSVEPVVPVGDKVEPVKWFRDVGWVALHSNMHNPGEHISFITKSSRYGSISHSHGDQNAFQLHAYGEPLAIDSGYYVAFGSTMHRNWRRQTRSKNAILIDGIGQYAGTDKVLNMAASGEIELAEMRKAGPYVRANATQAFKETVPYLKRYIRETYFINNSYFVIVDSVDLDQPGRVDWLFHTLYEMKLKGQTFRVQGRKAEMEGRFVYSSSGELSLSQHNEYTDVDPSEYEGLDRQWHLTASTREARSHRLVTLLVPMKVGESKYVSYFMDDQDHGVHLYFTDQGLTHKVEVQKAY
jgi:hypothetical protein